VRLICCAISGNGSKLDVATSKCITSEFFFTISDFIVIGLVLSVSRTLSKYPTITHLTLDVDVVPSAVRILKPGVLRVKRNEGSWLLEPAGATKTRATYFIYTDSGGKLPAFLANVASEIGIKKVFAAVRKQVKDPKYR